MKGVDVSIPRDRFTVVTGVSGSGKSTLAFDILFAEGQRRYLESLNAYARQFVQPARRAEVDAVLGIPPTVAIEQRTGRGGRKSTVATLTRPIISQVPCSYASECSTARTAAVPSSRGPRTPSWPSCSGSDGASGAQVLAPLVVARKGYYTDLARWAAGKGYRELRVDGVMTPTGRWPRIDRFREHDIDLPVGEVVLGAAPRRGPPRSAGDRLRARQRARAGRRVPLLHPARLPLLRAQLSRARSPALLLQLEARLVRALLRHRRAPSRVRRGAERGGGVRTTGSRARRRPAPPAPAVASTPSRWRSASRGGPSRNTRR